MTRQEANKALLEILAKKVQANPDARLGQIIHNLNSGMVNVTPEQYIQHIYNEEPEITLKRWSHMMDYERVADVSAIIETVKDMQKKLDKIKEQLGGYYGKQE